MHNTWNREYFNWEDTAGSHLLSALSKQNMKKDSYHKINISQHQLQNNFEILQ